MYRFRKNALVNPIENRIIFLSIKVCEFNFYFSIYIEKYETFLILKKNEVHISFYIGKNILVFKN